MAYGINFLAGAVAHSVPSPAGTATKRSGVEQKSTAPLQNEATRAEQTELLEKVQDEWTEKGAREKREDLHSILELAETLSLASDTTIHFQRNDDNGRMYMHVMDKHTGEELYRIPRDFLQELEQQSENHHLDVRI
jgi:uncharacterized FlaG/YvyC family protein